MDTTLDTTLFEPDRDILEAKYQGARKVINQFEDKMTDAVAVIDRQQALLRRCRKAMLRVTFNRIDPDEWEHIDRGLMEELRKEVNL